MSQGSEAQVLHSRYLYEQTALNEGNQVRVSGFDQHPSQFLLKAYFTPSVTIRLPGSLS